MKQYSHTCILILLCLLLFCNCTCEKKITDDDNPPKLYKEFYHPALNNNNLAFYKSAGTLSGIYMGPINAGMPDLFFCDPPGYAGIDFTTDGKYLILGGKDDIYKVEIATQKKEQLTTNGVSYFPDCHPNGEKIIYDNLDGTIWEMSTSGNDKVLITEGVDPCYSPDGNTIYFSRYSDGHLEIFSYDGSETKQLTDLKQDYTAEVTVSPSGGYLAFTSNNKSQLPQVYIYDILAGKCTQLTANYGCYPVFWSNTEICYVKPVKEESGLRLIFVNGTNDRSLF